MPVVAVGDVTGAVTEHVAPAGSITDTGTIGFSDVDLTDIHSLSAVMASAGALGTLTASVSTDTTNSGVGGVVTWNYSVAAAAHPPGYVVTKSAHALGKQRVETIRPKRLSESA